MSATPRTVTMACMIMTGAPEGTIYGVYRGRLSFRKGQPHSFDLNRAQHVASVAVPKGAKADYLQMAKSHETPEFPAFVFGMGS